MDPSAPEYKYPGHTNNINFIAVDRAYNTQPEVSQAHLVRVSLLHCQSCQVYLPTPYHSRYPMSRQDINIINITNVYLIQKSMVKLSPMVVPMPGESKQMKFDRWI